MSLFRLFLSVICLFSTTYSGFSANYGELSDEELMHKLLSPNTVVGGREFENAKVEVIQRGSRLYPLILSLSLSDNVKINRSMARILPEVRTREGRVRLIELIHDENIRSDVISGLAMLNEPYEEMVIPLRDLDISVLPANDRVSRLIALCTHDSESRSRYLSELFKEFIVEQDRQHKRRIKFEIVRILDRECGSVKPVLNNKGLDIKPRRQDVNISRDQLNKRLEKIPDAVDGLIEKNFSIVSDSTLDDGRRIKTLIKTLRDYHDQSAAFDELLALVRDDKYNISIRRVSLDMLYKYYQNSNDAYQALKKILSDVQESDELRITSMGKLAIWEGSNESDLPKTLIRISSNSNDSEDVRLWAVRTLVSNYQSIPEAQKLFLKLKADTKESPSIRTSAGAGLE